MHKQLNSTGDTGNEKHSYQHKQEKLVTSQSHRKDKAELGASQWNVLIISDKTVAKLET